MVESAGAGLTSRAADMAALFSEKGLNKAHWPPLNRRSQSVDKEGKTGFFLLCGKQAKINALILLIFYCVSSILSASGWGLSAASAPLKRGVFVGFVGAYSGLAITSLRARVSAYIAKKRAKKYFYPLQIVVKEGKNGFFPSLW
ncbi:MULTISPECIES: hypothetical protein [Tenebrionibacter/Tenebrionicola group]|jgi:hypothetical protein|uniref:Uncharacterized protein n=2 Tax=Tenebrionibacter/Tenebrionicola group TaxID=2969848 RepID=A0A8K0XX11_9ENTR|nr:MULTISPECIES: hypothetical protein [Tenebrionibacter/Tenebrionicola group]MBK4716085.1 hypothetical protein [Tenebrionibacter intestinalis]MBV5095986.1 hypothetical protein [Tenebrionicola larvae]